jgi:hypothetical protein
MKYLVPLFAAVCTVQISASAQESNPAAAAEAAYDYLHSPARDKEIAWLKSGLVQTSSDSDEAALDLVKDELTSDLERLLAEQRELTGSLEDPSFFDLQSVTSKEIVSARYETTRRYIDLMKRNTLGEWQRKVTERLAKCGASEEGKQKFLANFMAGMEESFTQRLQAMGYTDRSAFGQDLAQSERELLWWQEIFKMLLDTYGRWHLESNTKQIAFESELENTQFTRLVAKVTPPR